MGLSFAVGGLIVGFFVARSDAWILAVLGWMVGTILGFFFDVFKRSERLADVEKLTQWTEKVKRETQQEIKVSLGKIARRYK